MPVKLKTDFEVPAGTHTVLVRTDHYWGRAATKDEAMALCKSHGGRPSITGYVAYYFGPGIEPLTCWVDDFGGVHWTYADEAAVKARPQPVIEDRVAPSYRA